MSLSEYQSNEEDQWVVKIHNEKDAVNAENEIKLVRNKILVLGRRGVGKLAVIKQIISTASSSDPQTSAHDTLSTTPSSSDPDSENHAGITLPWHIHTKYYSANVQFWIDETVHEDNVNLAVIQAYEAEENEIGKVVDAVVFVFRKDEPSTFTDIRSYLPFIARYEPAITLAVGTSKSTTNGGDDTYMDWCLENGFEYVDLDAKTRGEDYGGEYVGIDRILEALQSHMWDGLTRVKTPGTSKLKTATLQGDGEFNQELLEAISKLNIENEEVIGDLDTTGLLKDRFDAPFDDTDAEFFGDIPSMQEVHRMHQQLFGDFDLEDEADDNSTNGLEGVLARLKSLREKGQQLPDDERRKLAASVALSFGMQMGDDGE